MSTCLACVLAYTREIGTMAFSSKPVKHVSVADFVLSLSLQTISVRTTPCANRSAASIPAQNRASLCRPHQPKRMKLRSLT